MPLHARHVLNTGPSFVGDADESVREQLRALQAAFRSHLPVPETSAEGTEEYLLSQVPLFNGRTGKNAPITYIKDCAGRYLFANSAWEAVAGSGWFGKTDREIWPKASAAELGAMDARVLKELCVCQGVLTLDAGGEERRWLATEFPIEVDSGSDRLIGGVALPLEDAEQVASGGNVRPPTGYQDLLDGIPAGIYRIAPDGRLVYANSALLRMLGCSKFAELAGSRSAGPVRRGEFVSLIENEGELRGFDAVWVRHDGAEIRTRETARRVKDASGHTLFYEGVVEQVLQNADHQLSEADRNRVLEAIANHAALRELLPEITRIAEVHLPGSLCSISIVDGCKLSLRADGRLPVEFAAAIKAVEVGTPCGNPALVARIGEPLVVGDIEVHPCWAELREVAMKNGLRSCTSVPLLSTDGRVSGTFDVYRREPYAPGAAELELIESAARLASMALDHHRRVEQFEASPAITDPLTKLPNRSVFEAELEDALAAPQLCHLAVIWIDLDRLTSVNDNLGHRAGDELLKMIAARLVEASVEGSHVCRSGGDEFAIFIPRISSATAAEAAAAKLVAALRKPIHIHDQDVVVTCSAGIAVYPDDGTTAAALLRNADAAMYRAKAWGKNTAVRYQPAINDSKCRLELENDLRVACRHNELELFYQPQVDMLRRVDGLEALLRWRHPKLGLLCPAQFLPIAEETGLIIDPIGEWVLSNACMQYVNWCAGRRPGLRIAVNVSAAQVYRTDLPRIVATILEQTGMSAENMEIELTESVLMHNLEESARKVNALRALGVTIAIDDFGTGYSSLSYLRHLPVDTLKLDKSFIDGIGSRSGNALIRAVTTLARELGLRLIAEGVETEQQMTALRDIGIGHIQGFLISKPVPAREARVLLN